MCNAAKHSPGCNCGFGPPYPPVYSAVNVTDWSREVVDRPELIERGLRESAWDQGSIDAFIEKYLALKNAEQPLPAETLAGHIRALLGMRQKVVESVEEVWINVPLYRFGAPDVVKAEVQYSEGDKLVDTSGWLIRVLGIGTGASTTLRVNKSHTYVAQAGTWKEVTVPVKLRVSHVAVYDGNRLLGRGYDAQVAPMPPGTAKRDFLRGRRCRTISASALGPRPEAYDDVLEREFRDDTSTAVHKAKRSWEAEVANEVSVALGKVVNVSALVNVKRTRVLELDFSLPAGHDYLAYMTGGGIWWERPYKMASQEDMAANRLRSA